MSPFEPGKVFMPTTCYPADDLRQFMEELFGSTGVSTSDARLVADMFLEANLRGVDSHGIRLIPAYITRLVHEGVNPTPKIKVVSDLGAAVRLDGDNCLGQVAGYHAMNLAMKRAASHGIGFALVGRTSHTGAGSYYVRMPLERNMAGFATSNNLPSLFVWGGLKRALSNPPVSISFPARKTPFILDICLGTVAWNKIYMKLNENRSIPQGWAWNADGIVTTDPKAASEGGSIIPIGGHKGSGITVAVDLFTGVLSGFHFAEQIGGLFTSDSDPEGCSCIMMALDVTRILGPEVLDRAEELIRWLKESPLAREVEEIVMPGEPEQRMRKQRLKTGIPISDYDIQQLKETARRQGVNSPFG